MKLLLVVALLGCMVAWAQADDAPTHSCGALQKFKIKRQWRTAYGEGKHRLEFALHFWTRFFKGHPKDRDGFQKFRGDNIYSPQFQAFSQRRFAAFGMVIDTTDDPEALKIMLEYAKADDKATGIKPEFYEDTRDALMETLGEYLGSRLDWGAWTDCLNLLMSTLK